MEKWIDIGSVDELSARPLQRVTAMNREFAVSCSDGRFGCLKYLQSRRRTAWQRPPGRRVHCLPLA